MSAPSVSSAPTAKMLGALHRELSAEGLPEDLVDQIVLMGAREVLEQGGFCVKEVAE